MDYDFYVSDEVSFCLSRPLTRIGQPLLPGFPSPAPFTQVRQIGKNTSSETQIFFARMSRQCQPGFKGDLERLRQARDDWKQNDGQASLNDTVKLTLEAARHGSAARQMISLAGIVLIDLSFAFEIGPLAGLNETGPVIRMLRSLLAKYLHLYLPQRFTTSLPQL